MSTVAILGGGDLGGALAHALARRARVRAIRLIDPMGGVAAGKALDILQSGPIEQYQTRLSGSADVSEAIGAAAIVVCDRVGQPPVEWQGDAALSLLRPLARAGAPPPLVFAGVGQRELMFQAATELGWPRQRMAGAAPESLAASLRAMVAVEADCSPQDVSIAIAGVPGVHLVVSWNDATIAGQPLTRVLPPVSLARLDARAARLWPPGPYVLAAAAARLVEAFVVESRHRFTAFAVLDGELGVRRQVAAVPVTVKHGAVRVLEPTLGPRERVAFDTALA